MAVRAPRTVDRLHFIYFGSDGFVEFFIGSYAVGEMRVATNWWDYLGVEDCCAWWLLLKGPVGMPTPTERSYFLVWIPSHFYDVGVVVQGFDIRLDTIRPNGFGKRL